MYSSAYVWAKILGHMENRLTAPVVSTWFDDAEVVELTEQKLVLCSPSEFRRDIIERRCIPYIQDAMQELFQMDVQVEVLLKDTTYTVLRWQAVSTADWEPDTGLELWDGDPVTDLGA